MLSKIQHRFVSAALPYAVLLFSILVTLVIWRIWLNYEKLQARDKHGQYIRLEKDKIHLRINAFIENLYALKAASKSERIFRSEKSWNSYVQELGLFTRYNAILSANLYRYDSRKTSFRLYREAHKDSYRAPRELVLNPEHEERRKKAVKDHLPFAFIEDPEAESPVLYLFLSDSNTAKRNPQRYFSFQIHLPLLIEDLFGDRARQRPDPEGIAYTEVLSIDIAGARYNIYFLVDKVYAEEATYISTLFLVAGLIFSVLLFLIMLTLTQSRERALNLAHKMTGEYRKAKQEADRANSAKSDFLARMSHEIRTPLNAIIGVGDLLRESNLSPEQERYTKLFSTSSEMLLSIINDVLDISKIESGRLEIECLPFDLPELASDVLALFSGKAQEKGIELELSIARDTGRGFLGDPTRIRQILVNLISNAVKFTQKGKVTLAIHAKKHDYTDYSTVHFEVRDTGIGIPDERLTSIFESFTQVDASTTRKYGGTGLGLTICKKLCNLMDGDIHAQNNPEGGASFIFYLPLKRAPKAELNRTSLISPPTSETRTNGTPRHRILLAEDTQENAILVQAFLKNFPATVRHVENGKEALEAIMSGEDFDLILMDIQMPVMDGLAATRKIREWEKRNNRNPVIITALTAHALGQYQDEGLKAGCTDFLSKPIRKKQLLDYLEQTLG